MLSRVRSRTIADAADRWRWLTRSDSGMKMKAIDSIPAPKLSIRLRPEYPGHVGAYDFVEERTHDGRKFRTRCQHRTRPPSPRQMRRSQRYGRLGHAAALNDIAASRSARIRDARLAINGEVERRPIAITDTGRAGSWASRVWRPIAVATAAAGLHKDLPVPSRRERA